MSFSGHFLGYGLQSVAKKERKRKKENLSFPPEQLGMHRSQPLGQLVDLQAAHSLVSFKTEAV